MIKAKNDTDHTFSSLSGALPNCLEFRDTSQQCVPVCHRTGRSRELEQHSDQGISAGAAIHLPPYTWTPPTSRGRAFLHENSLTQSRMSTLRGPLYLSLLHLQRPVQPYAHPTPSESPAAGCWPAIRAFGRPPPRERPTLAESGTWRGAPPCFRPHVLLPLSLGFFK